MANLSPPPRKTKLSAGKGAPPPESQPSTNLKKAPPARIKDLNFKVPYEFWKEYKITAMEQGMTMVEYLRTTHEFYQKFSK